MRLDASQQMRTDMRMRMAPRMIQSMEILQMPWMELQERIDQELIDNPVLEELRDSRTTTQTETDAEAEAPKESTETESEPADLVGGDAEFDDADNWEAYEEHRPSRAALMEESDRKLEAMQNMAARPPSLLDHLTDQLSFVELSPRIRRLAELIVQNLDEHGYFRHEPTFLIRESGGEASFQDVEEAIAAVQRLEPAGVGARDLGECLLLQLTPETPMRDVLRLLITHHLDDLEQNRLPAIEKRTGLSITEIKDAIDHLRHLNPRPGAAFANSFNQFVVADLIVETDDQGNYHVRLIDEHVPQLSISRRYQRMLRDRTGDPAARAYIQKKLQAARWLIESIEQRRGTLLKVAKAIIAHQQDFLDKGPESIQPLKMQQIADQVGVHVTTVSRAVDDKWVQTPRGIFALKRFFGGGTTTTDGEEVAWDTIKQKLLEVIAKEDKSNPMSDEEVVEELGRHGLTVARRTVTKYRKALKIPPSRQRRQY
jgi:RNA polymerase sigma-54 factor